VKPGQVRTEEGNRKGYTVEAVQEALNALQIEG
jgi:hypothetical protein